LVVWAAFPHHDRSTVRAVSLDAGDPTPAGKPGVALEADAETFVTQVLRFVAVHDDLLSVGESGRLKCLSPVV
jgi:hypothetical protein